MADGGCDVDGSSSSSSSSFTFPLEEDSGTEQPELRILTSQRLSRSKEPAHARLARRAEEGLGLSLESLLLGLAAALWVATGLLAVTRWGEEGERKDTITAIYLLVQIITTIGYGDITPESQGMQLFMAFYVLIGNVLTALVISEWVQSLINRSRTILASNRMSNIVEGAGAMRGDQSGAAPEPKSSMALLRGPLPAFLVYMFFVLLGALYYGMMDNCVCKDIWDCSRGDSCEESGGQLRSVCDSFYMSVITLTTIGYGDELPASLSGRLFCIFWMLFGVASMAKFSAELAHVILRQNMQSMADHGMSHGTFVKIDQDGNGALSKFEFITYMLVKYGLITVSDLDTLLLEFEKLDKDGNGELTYEEVSIM